MMHNKPKLRIAEIKSDYLGRTDYGPNYRYFFMDEKNIYYINHIPYKNYNTRKLYYELEKIKTKNTGAILDVSTGNKYDILCINVFGKLYSFDSWNNEFKLISDNSKRRLMTINTIENSESCKLNMDSCRLWIVTTDQDECLFFDMLDFYTIKHKNEILKDYKKTVLVSHGKKKYVYLLLKNSELYRFAVKDTKNIKNKLNSSSVIQYQKIKQAKRIYKDMKFKDITAYRSRHITYSNEYSELYLIRDDNTIVNICHCENVKRIFDSENKNELIKFNGSDGIIHSTQTGKYCLSAIKENLTLKPLISEFNAKSPKKIIPIFEKILIYEDENVYKLTVSYVEKKKNKITNIFNKILSKIVSNKDIEYEVKIVKELIFKAPRKIKRGFHCGLACILILDNYNVMISQIMDYECLKFDEFKYIDSFYKKKKL